MSDPRFARLHTDPRFVRPKASRNKFVVDDRFKQLFEEGQASGKKSKLDRKVDKYGRPLEKDSSVNDLKRYYRLASPSAEEGQAGAGEEDGSAVEEEDVDEVDLGESSEEDEEDSEEEEEEEEPVAGPSEGKGLVDYARGAVLLESSDEEELESDAESVSSSAEGSVTLGGRSARRRASRSPSIDLSEGEPSAFPDEEDAFQSDEEEEADADPTKRVALVNLDWDHLRASDLYRVLASSLSGMTGSAPPPKPNKGKKAVKDDVDDIKLSAKLAIAPGRLLSLRIYPSQFGRERMEREAIEGPPADVLRAKGADSSGDENDDDKTLKLGRKSKSREKARRRKLGGMSDEEEDFTAQDLVDEQVREGEEDYDTEALRKYQLERLRYYFAIATFDSASTAAHVVEQINGTEFERTANVFDMQYVPDDTSFDDDPVHDEATEASIAAEGNSYQGLDFQTDALRHSKVKLTWDADDPHRKTKIQTYLAGVLDKSKQKGATKGRPKITEDDVAQYLASSSDEDEDAEAEEEADDFFEAAEPVEEPAAGEKKTKKVSKRERLRGLLGLTAGAGAAGGDGEMEMSWDGEAAGGKKARKAAAEGDMQITFAPALSERSAKQLDFADDEKPETSIERYKRKEKERKERKKAERKARAQGRLDENGEPLTPSADVLAAQGDDAGFDDDFFADGGEDPFAAYDNGGADSGDEIGLPKKGKKDAAKLSKQERRAQREAEEKAAAEEQAKLGLLIGSDDEQDMFGADGAGEGGRHFDMRAVLKAEKNQGKKRKLKGKKAKQAKEQEVVQDNFKIDTTDDRFKSLHNDFDFAIDPSNPRYQRSRNMEALLAEGRKRRAEKNNKLREPVTASEDRPARKRTLPTDTGDSLDKLVEAVKRKAGDAGGRGKRTKVDL
ncbi:hypothetical protein JCM10908_006410 [Rhodotorula pacifica]|uniref:pre-rRNA-processing protein ESF1 n=1 Tax=Rhodotorula pacifica TaxID=1495444 RepID=UPI00316D4E42